VIEGIGRPAQVIKKDYLRDEWKMQPARTIQACCKWQPVSIIFADALI
jgi:hypothetical protein